MKKVETKKWMEEPSASVRCSGAAVLRLYPSNARLIFLKIRRFSWQRFMKATLASLGMRRSTAAPLQQIAIATHIEPLEITSLFFICESLHDWEVSLA